MGESVLCTILGHCSILGKKSMIYLGHTQDAFLSCVPRGYETDMHDGNMLLERMMTVSNLTNDSADSSQSVRGPCLA